MAMHVRQFGQRTFASFSVRNYRLYFIGQSVSMCGNWMQIIGQDLLVLDLTGSGTQLGIVTALQTLPILLFGSFAGVLIDRLPKRTILYYTQSISGILALLLGTLVATGTIEMWMLYIIATCLGLVTMIDNPTRQNFVHEMVGRDLLANAVSLNSTEINMARVIGPSIAGALVAFVGLSACFFINGLSYIAVLIMLGMINVAELHSGTLATKARGQLLAGFRYVRSMPTLWVPLLMMAIIGTLSYEFRVVLPMFSTFTFDGHAGTYAAMTAAMGVGSVIGGGYTASRRQPGMKVLVLSAALFGASIIVASVAPTLPLALAALVVVGFFSINFTSLGNTTLQLSAAPEMRGRVMALWTVAFMGSTPIGGPIVGAIGEHWGPRWSLFVGGLAAIIAAGIGAMVLRRMRASAPVTAIVTSDGGDQATA
jgi:MFS family permease